MKKTPPPKAAPAGAKVNPIYRPTPAQLELDKQAEEHRRRCLAAGQDPPRQVGAPETAQPAADFVAEVCARFGKPLPLPGIFEQLAEERAAQDRRDAIAREEGWRVARFERYCPPRFREAWDWSKVSPEINTPAARAEIARVMAWQPGPGGKGLYIVGASGHSKSRLLFRLIRRLIVDDRRKVLVLDGAGFSNLMTKAFGTPDETERLLREVCQVPILAIDDFGKRWTPATEEGAFTVIDRRTAHNLPVLLTLNYSAADLMRMQNARGDLAQARDVVTPLIRRLADYCEVVPL